MSKYQTFDSKDIKKYKFVKLFVGNKKSKKKVPQKLFAVKILIQNA